MRDDLDDQVRPRWFAHALVELRAGVPDDALPLLLSAARAAVGSRPVRAVTVLMAISEAAFQAQAEDAWAEVGRLVEEIQGAVKGDQAVLARLLRAATRPSARGVGADDLARLEAMDAPELQVRAAGLVWALGDHALARRLRSSAVDRARARGAAGTLAWALQYVVLDELRRGRHVSAEASADEGRRLALETGQPNVACQHAAALVELVALRGEEEQARRLAEEALARATVHRLVGAAVVTRRALARLELSRGSREAALEHMEAVRGLPLPGHGGVALYALADLVEAAVRAGRDDLRESLAADVALVAASGSGHGRPGPSAPRVGGGGEAALPGGHPAVRRRRPAVRRHHDRGGRARAHHRLSVRHQHDGHGGQRTGPRDRAEEGGGSPRPTRR